MRPDTYNIIMYTMKLTSSYITLDALRFYAYHGVDEQERRVGNEYQVDLVLKADIGEACRTDCLEGTVNYADVCQAVKQVSVMASVSRSSRPSSTSGCSCL